MSINTLQGSKKGKNSSASSTPDTYFTEDNIEIVLGISEGQIKGLKDDNAQHFYVGDTPLMSTAGTPNFENFQLTVNRGSPFGEVIVPRLGGASSSITINTELSKDIPVIRQGQQRNIDWLELRFVINALYLEHKDAGAVKNNLAMLISYKRVSSPDWIPAVLYRDPGLDVQTSEAAAVLTQTGSVDASTASRRQVVVGSPTEPDISAAARALGTVFGDRVIWMDERGGLKVFRSGGWFTPNNLKRDTSQAGETRFSWTDANYVRVVEPGRTSQTRSLFYTSQFPPKAPQIGDLWMADIGHQWYNGRAWVDVLPPEGQYDPMRGAIVERSDGGIEIWEKITSPAVKELKIKVDRIDEPYMVRVIKLSEDSNANTRTDASWESIQEINSDPLIFPNLATIHLTGQASDQFSSVPEFSGVYCGREIRVPSNYDPATRTYNGVWDRTWKIAYTNNPAFVANDLVMNDRYGLNSTYPVELDPDDVYEAGLWCDAPVGIPPRPQFTFNGLIAEPRSAREAIQYVCGIFGGRFFDDGNGYARLKLDKDDNAVHLFTKENVEQGIFTYAYTDASTRKNDLTVAFVNPELNWQEDRRRVFDQNHIEIYGRVPEDFIAVGCTSAAEAIARGRQKLITEQTEKESVTFTTNRVGLYLEPYDVFLVADDGLHNLITGRISGRGDRYVDLRDEVYLEAGFNHKLVLSGLGDGEFAVHEIAIAPTSVGKPTKRLALAENPPANLPEQAVFTIDSGRAGKPYRLLKMEPVDGNPDKITLTGIEVNRLKWTQVHQGDGPVEVDIPDFETTLTPITNLRVIPRIEQVLGRPKQILGLSWDPHPNKFVRRYEVAYRLNDSQWITPGEFGTTTWDLDEVIPGRYVFQVRGVSLTGQKTTPAFVDIDLTGNVRPVSGVYDLVLENKTDEIDGFNVYEGTEARFSWKYAGPQEELAGYDVILYNDKDTQVRLEPVPLENYVYSLDRVYEDDQTRRFRLAVRARDVFGNVSPETEIHVYNPAPPVLSPLFTPAPTVANLMWDRTSPLDYVGTLIWVSEEPGGVDVTKPPAYDLSANQVSIPLDGRDYLWVVLAGYDHFGRKELNYTGEITIYDLDFDIDFEAPETPTGFTITSRLEGDIAVIEFRWNPNSESDLAGYRLRVRELEGDYVTFQTTDTYHEVRLPAGAIIEARLSAFDRYLNYSVETDTIRHVVAADTIPPAVPTNLSIRAGFRNLWLKWDANTESDLSHYEIYSTSDGEEVLTGATAPQYTTRSNTAIFQDLESGETRFYYVRAVDYSGNASDFSEGVSGATVVIETLDNAEAIPTVVNELPEIKEGTPRKVYLRTDGRWYVQKDGEWVEETDVRLLTGKLQSEQIADLAISREKVQLGAIDAGALALGAVGPTAISMFAISTPKMKSNAVTTRVLRANSILSKHLTAGSVVTETLDAGAVTAQKIGVGELEAQHFSAGVILSEFIGARQITADKIDVKNVITLSAQIADAIIDSAHIFELDAAKIRAGSILSGSLKVNNQTLGEIEEVTEDPAAAINARETSIDPGKILIKGATRLQDWIHGGDSTLINGGKIAANTVKANVVEIGQRGITIEGVEFEHNKPNVHGLSWSAGSISYIADDGSTKTVAITAGSTTWSGKTVYVYWQKDATSLSVSTSVADAMMSSSVALAQYRGFTDLVATYGRTIIDGGKIKAFSIMTDQIDSRAIQARNIDALAINSGHVQSNTIGSNHIQSRSITTEKIALGNVDGNIIAQNSIANGHLGVGAVSGNKLGNLAVTNAHLAGGAVDGNKLGNLSVSGHHIADRQIWGEHKLALSSIGGTLITSGAISAPHILARAINADHLNVNTIRAEHIIANQITTEKINTGAVSGFVYGEGMYGSVPVDGGTVVVLYWMSASAPNQPGPLALSPTIRIHLHNRWILNAGHSWLLNNYRQSNNGDSYSYTCEGSGVAVYTGAPTGTIGITVECSHGFARWLAINFKR